MGEVWSAIAEFTRGWDWSAIAAFIAVAATLRVARADMRDRRQQIRQEAMVELNQRLVAWTSETRAYFDLMDTYRQSRLIALQEQLNQQGARVSEAISALDRAFKSIHMTNTDFTIGGHLTNAEWKHAQFVAVFRDQPIPGSREDEITTIGRIVSTGRPLVDEVESLGTAIIDRGFDIHRLRWTWRFRLRRAIRKWRNRKGELT